MSAPATTARTLCPTVSSESYICRSDRQVRAKVAHNRPESDNAKE